MSPGKRGYGGGVIQKTHPLFHPKGPGLNKTDRHLVSGGDSGPVQLSCLLDLTLAKARSTVSQAPIDPPHSHGSSCCPDPLGIAQKGQTTSTVLGAAGV